MRHGVVVNCPPFWPNPLRCNSPLRASGARGQNALGSCRPTGRRTSHPADLATGNAKRPSTAKRGSNSAPGGASPAGCYAPALALSSVGPAASALSACRISMPKHAANTSIKCWRALATPGKRWAWRSITVASSGRASWPHRWTTTTESGSRMYCCWPTAALISPPSQAAGAPCRPSSVPDGVWASGISATSAPAKDAWRINTGAFLRAAGHAFCLVFRGLYSPCCADARPSPLAWPRLVCASERVVHKSFIP